jgi:hypothetical protein
LIEKRCCSVTYALVNISSPSFVSSNPASTVPTHPNAATTASAPTAAAYTVAIRRLPGLPVLAAEAPAVPTIDVCIVVYMLSDQTCPVCPSEHFGAIGCYLSEGST